MIVLPQTDIAGAIRIVERIQENIRARKIKHEYTQHNEKYITLSIGISQLKPDTDKAFTDIVHRADEALYSAKEAGRNIYTAAN